MLTPVFSFLCAVGLPVVLFIMEMLENRKLRKEIDDKDDQVRSLSDELEDADDMYETLSATIGSPPADSHPDENKPRAATWHEERANWKAEVEQLRNIIRDAVAGQKSMQEIIVQRDATIAELRSAESRLQYRISNQTDELERIATIVKGY